MLTTKTYNPMDTGADRGLAPERVARQLESSMERLGVERVDLYLAHDFDFEVPLDETFAAIEREVDAGKVAAYGVSNFSAGQLNVALEVGSPQAVQNEYSLLARYDEAELLPLCEREHVSYLVFSPLAGGWLTGKYRRGEPFPAGSRMTQRPEPYAPFVSGHTFDLLEQFDRLARARETSMAGLALAWLLADQRVTQIVVGPGRPEHLAPIAEAIERPLSSEERATLDSVFS
jgi:aryl-alcohol dehydrogenase-like predicted oxidoreductase